MYIRKSNYKVHTRYTNEEKEKIVLLYLNHEMGLTQIVRQFDLADRGTLYGWAKNYKKMGVLLKPEVKLQKLIHLIKVVLENIQKNL